MGKKPTRYELILLFDRDKVHSIPELAAKLKGRYSQAALYRYHALYSVAHRKEKELEVLLK